MCQVTIDIVLPRLKRIVVPLDLNLSFILDKERALEHQNNLDHLIEKSIRQAVGEMQATKYCLGRIFGIIDVNITPF